jgi:hypothetical protein
MEIDASLYPDSDHPPRSLDSLADRADYLHRVCTAWDFHIHPQPETFETLRGWRDVFDQFPVSTSPAYHTFREWFGWPAVPSPRHLPSPRPTYLEMDQAEGRPPDPCELWV